MNKKDDFQYYVTRFLTSYMAGQRNLSRNTISSYADTFRLLLIFFADEKGIRADKITLNQISREHIVEFLDWLEETRGVTAATRNIRLAAIHSFIRFVQIEDPTHLDEYRKILKIIKVRKKNPLVWLGISNIILLVIILNVKLLDCCVCIVAIAIVILSSNLHVIWLLNFVVDQGLSRIG